MSFKIRFESGAAPQEKAIVREVAACFRDYQSQALDVPRAEFASPSPGLRKRDLFDPRFMLAVHRRAADMTPTLEREVSLACCVGWLLQHFERTDHAAFEQFMYPSARQRFNDFGLACCKLELAMETFTAPPPRDGCWNAFCDPAQQGPHTTGALIGLMGAIGSGKSSLLRMLTAETALLAGRATALWDVETGSPQRAAYLLQRHYRQAREDFAELHPGGCVLPPKVATRVFSGEKLTLGGVASAASACGLVCVDYMGVLARQWRSGIFEQRQLLRELPARLRRAFPRATLILAHQLNSKCNTDPLSGEAATRRDGMDVKDLWPEEARVFTIGREGPNNTRLLSCEGLGSSVISVENGLPKYAGNNHITLAGRIMHVPSAVY